MSFGFCASAKKKLGVPDESMSAGQIAIQRQRLLALSHAPSFRWKPQLVALYKRLIAAGKGHKRALIACARKLLIFIDAVVARGTPWQADSPVVQAA